MFSSALKSFTSNISSNYSIAPHPATTSGPWKIFDAKRKNNGKPASVFVFDKKALEAPGGGLGGSGRSGGSSGLRKVHEEVLERLKKEASSLARLRHPSILELAEPVEETRNGGLMFATEPVTASLAGLLQEKDEQERAGGARARPSKFKVQDEDGSLQNRELEVDELEIQKGLLQLSKGLEFLHESAGLVHANLTPEAILVNAKGDWKIGGLGFCGPHPNTTAATSLTPISLFEVLSHDPRLPRTVQLDLDYTSPDFVLDNNLNPSGDMFSLGLLTLALYNSPPSSPLNTGGSLSAYKRVFSSSNSIPTRNNNFLIPSSRPLPPKLSSDLLPRLITRRPAQRLSAREFQEASYFDNILVSTIRFLDELPAKTASEKAQFMRGLPRIMPQFPKSVLGKKLLPALLEETKDRDLLAPIMSNVFAIVKAMPDGKKAFAEKIVPKLREVFLAPNAITGSKDASREAGLMIFLENISVAAKVCPGKEFRDDILPIILLAMQVETHAIVDAAISTLASVLPVLDFTTIKNELFPVIAAVFAKTSSLSIKIRGLEAFYTLCGGSSTSSNSDDDDLNGLGVSDAKSKSSGSSVILDKYTVQDRIVPLLKGIKTKEPGVMMAALRVFKQVGQVADAEFVALEVLPTLWAMALGPLLDLEQFRAFMSLIKSLGTKIERERESKFKDLSRGGAAGVGVGASRHGAGSSFGGSAGANGELNGMGNGDEADFETLVSGRKAGPAGDQDLMNDWGAGPAAAAAPARQPSKQTPAQSSTFSWQPPPPPQHTNTSALRQQPPTTRAVTPDQTLSSFATLTPSATQFSQPLQPTRTGSASNVPLQPAQQPRQASASGGMMGPSTPGGTSIDWSKAANGTAAQWSQQRGTQQQQTQQASNTSGGGGAGRGGFTLAPPPSGSSNLGQQSGSMNFGGQSGGGAGGGAGGQKKGGGLDQYESLL